jgi:parvulin-like peptidyl-prolyl isomerase
VAKKKKEEKPREYTRRQLSHFQKQQRRQHIIFIGGISIIVAIVLIVSLGWFFTEYRPLHRTVIKVADSGFNTSFYIDTLIYAVNANQDQPVETTNTDVPNIIIQDELLRLAAEPLGVVVDDKAVRKTLEDSGQPTGDAYVAITRTAQLQTRLKDEYFGATMVPANQAQVHIQAFLAESENLAIEAREKLINGENFSTIVGKYAQNTFSKYNQGDYDWKPAAILQEELDSQVPIDYAFAAEPGDLSPPLSDNASYKSLGYWLIKVLDHPGDNSSTVEALYLSSNELALEIKARLEAGESLAALADAYSQYTPSKEKHGELGVLIKTDNTTPVVSDLFDVYAFSPSTELGKWSNPIQDIKFSTQGGYWLVKVLGKEADRPLSDEDRQYLIDEDYNKWINDLWLQYSPEIDMSGLSSVLTWAVDRAKKELGY